MDESLYDEFGNYIGPEIPDSEDDSDDEEEEEEEDDERNFYKGKEENGSIIVAESDDVVQSDAIVLHEDKQYYPDASEVFPGAETITLDEDAQGIEEPLIAPVRTKKFSKLEDSIPETKYNPEFLTTLMETPSLIRNIALIGHFHHGKTLFTDALIMQTRANSVDITREWRFSDTRHDEQSRGFSIKSCPISMVLPAATGKSFLINVVDTPGHVNFEAEAAAAMHACDGAVLIVDAVEGVMMQTERLAKIAMADGLAISLVINKVDRLILELKLPPRDAYFKLQHTLEEVNALLARCWTGVTESPPKLSPIKGNVCFASSLHGWCFSIESFARVYCEYHSGSGVDPKAFSKKLWGDIWLDPWNRSFVKAQPAPNPAGEETERTFVQFILEPLYKIYSQILGEEAKQLEITLAELGVKLQPKQLRLNPKPLLRLVLGKFLGAAGGFVDMITRFIPSPANLLADKITRLYAGGSSSPEAQAMARCDPLGPLMINAVKLFSLPDGRSFVTWGRIYSGTARTGQRVRILGETYSSEDSEDSSIREVTAISVPGGRHRMDVTLAKAGNWVLLEGVDATIVRTATITDTEGTNEISIFHPLTTSNVSVMKLAVEPLRPAELPKMVEGLRRISKTYPMAVTKVEESGEHVINGTGELMLECAMHDLREMYAEIEVKVADPSCSFRETVIESSSLKCFSETPNKRNKLTMIAEPMEEGLALDIEHGTVSIDWDRKTIGDFFQSKFQWDLLSARSVWAFGPDKMGPNILVDDTLPSEVDRASLASIKGSIVQGFQWGCREGPLCDEPLRNTKFKILDAVVAADAIHRGGGQIIPTARRVAYSAFLLASPRLMEPVYSVQIQAPADVVAAIYPVLQRGHVIQDSPKPGAPFYTVQAYIPVLDSFGFETDLRSYTQGQAFCMQVFDHWTIVPGDPLDRNIILHPLEPSPPQHLAREILVKTRRRKGLSDDVSVNKFFDDPMLLEIAAAQDAEMRNSYY